MAGPACAAATNGGCKWQWRRHAQPARLAAAATPYLLSCILTRAACCLPKSDCSVDRCDLLEKHCCTGRCSLPAGCHSCTSRRCESMLLGGDAARATQGDPNHCNWQAPSCRWPRFNRNLKAVAGGPSNKHCSCASQHTSCCLLHSNRSLELQAGGPATSSSFNSRQLETEHAGRPVLGKRGGGEGPLAAHAAKGWGCRPPQAGLRQASSDLGRGGSAGRPVQFGRVAARAGQGCGGCSAQRFSNFTWCKVHQTKK